MADESNMKVLHSSCYYRLKSHGFTPVSDGFDHNSLSVFCLLLVKWCQAPLDMDKVGLIWGKYVCGATIIIYMFIYGHIVGKKIVINERE